jgi:hypothetical protein
VRPQPARGAKTQRAAEIENEIVAILKGQERRDHPEELDELLPTPDAAAALHLQLTRLHTIKRRYERNAIKDVRKRTRAIVKTIDRLKQQIEGAPTLLKLSLGTFDLGRRFDSNRKRKQAIDAFLGELRHQCEARLSNLPRSDRIKLECARSAHYLICSYTMGKPTSSENSPFRDITGLLYEHVTGSPDKDLRLACEKILRVKANTLGKF